MSRDSRKFDLRRTLVSRGFTRDRSALGEYRYVGPLEAAGRRISVAITFPDLEFTRLPQAQLLRPQDEAPEVVAHLSSTCEFCFARNDGLVLDRYDVGGTALQCLDLARQGLERALSHKHLEQEIAAEFPQHWQGGPFLYDLKRQTDGPAKIYTVRHSEKEFCLLLTDDAAVLRRLVTDGRQMKVALKEALPAYVMRVPFDLTFKDGFRQPATLDEFLRWAESLRLGKRRELIREIARNFPAVRVTALFLVAKNGCVGVDPRVPPRILKAAQRAQGLANLIGSNTSSVELDRLAGERFDQEFIFGRNMNGKTLLAGKRIALIGCGTIGSHLAKFLVQSGAAHLGGSMMLVDNQTLQPGNVGRHLLAMSAIGINKARAVKNELLRLFPDANIRAEIGDAGGHLSNLAAFDLVIDATGEEALSFSINDHLVKSMAAGRKPTLIRIALFGNGDAAQALLVDGLGHACLKCLRPNQSAPWRYSPLKAGVQATLTPAACGEDVFVAYGVAAPAVAAALGLQLALDWANGNPTPRLRTMRIDRRTTVEVKDKNVSRSKGCPACAEFGDAA